MQMQMRSCIHQENHSATARKSVSGMRAASTPRSVSAAYRSARQGGEVRWRNTWEHVKVAPTDPSKASGTSLRVAVPIAFTMELNLLSNRFAVARNPFLPVLMQRPEVVADTLPVDVLEVLPRRAERAIQRRARSLDVARRPCDPAYLIFKVGVQVLILKSAYLILRGIGNGAEESKCVDNLHTRTHIYAQRNIGTGARVVYS